MTISIQTILNNVLESVHPLFSRIFYIFFQLSQMTHFLPLFLIRGSSYGFFLSIPFGARQILFCRAEGPAENKNTDTYLLQQCVSGFNQNAV